MRPKIERPPFPAWIDSSTRLAFTECELKGAYSGLYHFKPKSVSNHLSAGGAFAHGIEVARKIYFTEVRRDNSSSSSSSSFLFFPNLSPAERADIASAAGALSAFLAKPEEDSADALGPKSSSRILLAVLRYFAEFPLDRDIIIPYINPRGEPAVEYKFAIPLPISHPETGEPLLYTGKFDMLAYYNGQYWPVDEKTTSRLGPSWASNFDLRGQFLGYTWAVREQGFECPGVIVRGIGLLKNDITFQVAPVRYPSWLINQWFDQLCEDIERFKKAWENHSYSQDFGESCGHYSGCAYKQLCLRPNPEEWVMTFFQKLEWNPLTEQDYTATDLLYEALCELT